MLEDGLEAQVETDDPVRDLIEASIEVFRRFVLEHPDLFRVTFQRQVPGFEPGPELLQVPFVAGPAGRLLSAPAVACGGAAVSSRVRARRRRG
ncbi:MAG: hypothetical protein ACK5PP_12835 [Acidimicrobiales bacterium]